MTAEEKREIQFLIDKRLLELELIVKDTPKQEELPFPDKIGIDSNISDEQLLYLITKQLLNTRKYNLETLEKALVKNAIKFYNNNKSKACIFLGISWQALDRRIKKYNLEDESNSNK